MFSAHFLVYFISKAVNLSFSFEMHGRPEYILLELVHVPLAADPLLDVIVAVTLGSESFATVGTHERSQFQMDAKMVLYVA